MMNSEHLKELEEAVKALESEGLAIKMLNYIGQPIEFVVDRIPKKIQSKILPVTEKALRFAAMGSIKTLGGGKINRFSNLYHKSFTTLTGAVSGFFGPQTLLIELPISTMTIFRSIADIAKKNGEDLRTPEALTACLEVFAMGGNNDSDDAMESSYYMVRAGTNKVIQKLSESISGRTLSIETPHFITKIISVIAPRYTVQITEKFIAQATPIIGAVGGATVNFVFLDHFQTIAEGQFTVRRLERIYGKELIKDEYMKIRNKYFGQ